MSKAGEVYCFWNAPFGVWMAFHVLKPYGVETDPEIRIAKHTAIGMLNWFSEQKPTALDAAQMELFHRQDFEKHIPENSCVLIAEDIPPYCSYVGKCPLLYEGKIHSFSSLWKQTVLMEYVQRWYAIPEQKRTYCHDIYFAKCTISNNRELAELPELINELYIKGEDFRMLDLHETYLTKLHVSLNNLDKLVLPKTMQSLYLSGIPKENLEITAWEEGKRIHLQFDGNVSYLKGLKRCTSLCVVLSADVDIDIAACVETYPYIYSLRIWGEFGTAKGFSALKQLPWLRQFQISGMYGFDAADFPTPKELPDLDYLVFDDVPKEALVHMRAKYRSRTRNMEKYFWKGRTEEWLKENRDNPLRSWQGREQIPMTKAKKAAVIYKELRRNAFAAVQDANFTRLEELFHTAAMEFYALDKKGSFLETVELEELYIAADDMISELETVCGMTLERKSLLQWFDGMLP
ncbi:MAG: hypothetical protein ACI4XB_00110 [Ruminococcus sp.]